MAPALLYTQASMVFTKQNTKTSSKENVIMKAIKLFSAALLFSLAGSFSASAQLVRPDIRPEEIPGPTPTSCLLEEWERSQECSDEYVRQVLELLGNQFPIECLEGLSNPNWSHYTLHTCLRDNVTDPTLNNLLSQLYSEYIDCVIDAIDAAIQCTERTTKQQVDEPQSYGGGIQ